MTTDERALATEARLNTLMETLADQFAAVHQRIDDLGHTLQIGFTVVAAIGAVLGAISAAQLTALIAIARALPK